MASVEVSVTIGDVPMNGMKQVDQGDASVLFVRDAAGVRAFQAKCPHYGAPLAKGAICDGKLYCPWHKAVFAVDDGALVEPPALDGLPHYPVRIDGDHAVAVLEAVAPSKAGVQGDRRHVVVVGTGAAAVAAVTTLRRDGFDGRITMIGRETRAPYDRPKLSKNFLAKPTKPDAMLLEPDFFAAHKIEAILQAATRIEPAARRVTLEDGLTIVGDALLIATGSRAARPDIPGVDREAVFTLRSLDDAVRLGDVAKPGKRIVVIGSGFIGLEAAAFLTKGGLVVTVVSPEALPLSKRFGDAVAAALKAYHESKGVTFVQGDVAALEGGAAVESVRLADGTILPADLVLLATGAKPETAVLDKAFLLEDGGVTVDATLALAPSVWVAGDIAAFPESRSGTMARIEHWRLAEQHGTHVARAILGATGPFVAAPFFWSNQGDKRLDYAGYAPEWDDTLTHGDVGALDFITYYIKGGKALAACAIGHNPALIAFLHRLDTAGAPAAGTLSEASEAA